MFFQKSQPKPQNGQRAVDLAQGEAAQQYLGKQAKIQTGYDAVMLAHNAQIAADEVADVRKLKAKHLGEQWAAQKAGEPMEIIVCDDYHHNDAPPASPVVPGLLQKALPWILAGALGLGTGGLGWVAGGGLSGKAPATTTGKGDGNTIIEFVK